MGKAIDRLPGLRLFQRSSSPGSVWSTHVESLGKPPDSTCVLKALPGTVDTCI